MTFCSSTAIKTTKERSKIGGPPTMRYNTGWPQVDDDLWQHAGRARCQCYHCCTGLRWVLYRSDGASAAGSSERWLTFPDATGCKAACDDINDALEQPGKHDPPAALSAGSIKPLVRPD